LAGRAAAVELLGNTIPVGIVNAEVIKLGNNRDRRLINLHCSLKILIKR
jgi:hypothetical protein